MISRRNWSGVLGYGKSSESWIFMPFFSPFSLPPSVMVRIERVSSETREPFKIEKGTTYRWRMFEVLVVFSSFFFSFFLSLPWKWWAAIESYRWNRSDRRRVQLENSVLQWQEKIRSIMGYKKCLIRSWKINIVVAILLLTYCRQIFRRK